MKRTVYHDLRITATSADSTIWLADDAGHLVQKATAVLETSVLAGRYIVEFNPDGVTYPLDLSGSRMTTEASLRAGPTCERPRLGLSQGEPGRQAPEAD